ncbi:hypothetical protein EV363DRAFT_1417519 [Boletus edulis]|nr:hypothetical protein EV363DRAFT_1417519 [Boletus edulis]
MSSFTDSLFFPKWTSPTRHDGVIVIGYFIRSSVNDPDVTRHAYGEARLLTRSWPRLRRGMEKRKIYQLESVRLKRIREDAAKEKKAIHRTNTNNRLSGLFGVNLTQPKWIVENKEGLTAGDALGIKGVLYCWTHLIPDMNLLGKSNSLPSRTLTEPLVRSHLGRESLCGEASVVKSKSMLRSLRHERTVPKILCRVPCKSVGNVIGIVVLRRSLLMMGGVERLKSHSNCRRRTRRGGHRNIIIADARMNRPPRQGTKVAIKRRVK